MNDDLIFSSHEKRFIEILGRRKMTIAQIAAEFYKSPEVIDPSNYVATVARRVKKKCEFYSLTWTLAGRGAGRAGRTVWRTKAERK